MARALLVYSNQIYYSTLSNAELTETPVTRLIEGVWDHHADHAFHLLRTRIFTDYALTGVCRATVKLAAKRVSQISEAEFDSALKSMPITTEIVPTKKSVPLVTPPESVEHLAEWMRTYSFGSDRPIVAVLIDQNKKPVLAAVNKSSKNRLLHAEVNLVRSYVITHGKKIPKDHTLWVSLKPCCMCGSFLSEWSEENTHIRVTYLENDPGPKARTSPLTHQKIYASGDSAI